VVGVRREEEWRRMGVSFEVGLKRILVIIGMDLVNSQRDGMRIEY